MEATPQPPTKLSLSTHLTTNVQADAEVGLEGQLHHSQQIREVQAIWEDGQKRPEGLTPEGDCAPLLAQPRPLDQHLPDSHLPWICVIPLPGLPLGPTQIVPAPRNSL